MPTTAKDLREFLFNRFPIVRFVFTQDAVALVQRPIDMNWYYRKISPISVNGFNPFGRQIFYGRNSYLEKIIVGCTDPIGDVEIDWYLYEVFFAVHDFIHIWAISALLPFFPKCTEPRAFEESDSVDELAYILLMSEVSAVVAMDYWMLSTINLSDDLGPAVRFRCLTTPFKQDSICDTKKLSAEFAVEGHSFFEWLAKGYFDGVFLGFEGIDVSLLRDLAPWLVKERRVGVSQRSLIKAWISYLRLLAGGSGNEVTLILNSHQRIEAMHALAGELWSIFGEAGGASALPLKSAQEVYLPTSSFPVDFRFIDLTRIDLDFATLTHSDLSTKQFGYFAAQYISLFDYNDEYEFDAVDFDEAVRGRSMQALFRVFGGVKPRAINRNKHVHLFLPN
ncbi:hypothetical protein B0G75_13925 [Paraburkholderia sp. BL18I3N2]|uniref:hypothetical protein n=1 Tax=Paraburkholderia sp. BL18I3N2 TaxID=1938799 RepID=UPI000D0785AB|nr:hypothetical protein [Paraburkholderia sp. BL18I3N2]PRX19162.1 hypothetical protein B0G75_13925 [Paraburkholderia sp. BL18I3N2]